MIHLKENINTASGKEKADLVLKNAYIINVFSQNIEKQDIAINKGMIVGIGKYNGMQEIDCTGKFAAPGLIDAHVHIESSMVTPEVFSQLVIKRGVTTVIADPHEIANVLGNEGIKFMLDNSKYGEVDIFYMLPSCVPATEIDDSGAVLRAEDLVKFIDEPNVLGLGEVMNVPAVLKVDDEMLAKIKIAQQKIIDGHCPQITEKALNAYLSAGIKTDHECSAFDEALKKVKRGMYILIREGSAARNLKDIIPAVNKDNYSRFLFCTDDRHILDLKKEGSVDNCIRRAIKEGVDPIKAYTMASFNAANCYGLRDRGAVAPGYKADIVIFEDLEKFKIKNVIKNGVLYSRDFKKKNSNKIIESSMNMNYVNEDIFKVKAEGDQVNTIKVLPHSIETKKDKKPVISKGGYVKKVSGKDINKIAVFERHKNTGKYSVGYVEGFGIKGCSIAQTISHDSHNVIVLGDNDEDMAAAVNRLIDIRGGIVIATKGEILEELSLPTAGLMSEEAPEIVCETVEKMNKLMKKFGVKKDIDPFLTLAFMSLTVIPEIKITPRGVFDYKQFKFIKLFDE